MNGFNWSVPIVHVARPKLTVPVQAPRHKKPWWQKLAHRFVHHHVKALVK